MPFILKSVIDTNIDKNCIDQNWSAEQDLQISQNDCQLNLYKVIALSWCFNKKSLMLKIQVGDTGSLASHPFVC